MEDIDILITKKKNRLIYKTHWIEYYEIFVFLVFIFFPIFIMLLSYRSSQDLRTVVIFTALIIAFILLMVLKEVKYRKFTIIKTGLPLDKNKLLMADFSVKKGFKLKFHDDDYIRSISGLKHNLMRQELTVVYQNDTLLINIVNSTGLIRLPSLFGIKRFANEYKKEINACT